MTKRTRVSKGKAGCNKEVGNASAVEVGTGEQLEGEGEREYRTVVYLRSEGCGW